MDTSLRTEWDSEEWCIQLMLELECLGYLVLGGEWLSWSAPLTEGTHLMTSWKSHGILVQHPKTGKRTVLPDEMIEDRGFDHVGMVKHYLGEVG